MEPKVQRKLQCDSNVTDCMTSKAVKQNQHFSVHWTWTRLVRSFRESKITQGDVERWFFYLGHTILKADAMVALAICHSHWTHDERRLFCKWIRRYKSCFEKSKLALRKEVDNSLSKVNPINQIHQLNRQAGFDEKRRKWDAQGLFTVEHIHSIDKSIIDTLSNLVATMSPTIQQYKSKIIRLIILFFELVSDSKMASKIRALMSFIADLDLSVIYNDIVLPLTQVIQGVIDSTSQALAGGCWIAQGGPDYTAFLSAIIKLLVATFGIAGATCIPIKSDYLKKFTSLAPIIRSGQALWQMLGESIKIALDVICEYFGFDSMRSQSLAMINEDITPWIDRVAVVSSTVCNGGAGSNRVLLQEMKELKLLGDKYNTQLLKLRVSAPVLTYFMISNNEIRKLCQQYVPHLMTFAPRVSPLVVYLWGPTNIGKSTMIPYIARLLMERNNLPFDYGNIYVRNNGQNFWDAYTNQSVVWYDDFMQFKSDEIRIVEMTDLIKMKNTTSFPLNMANVNDKGTVHFTSDLVLITSNLDIPEDIKGLVVSPAAIKRRRDIVIRCAIKPEFSLPANGGLDKTKLTGVGEFDPTIYEFYVTLPYKSEIKCNFAYMIEQCHAVWERLYDHEDKVAKGEDFVLKQKPEKFSMSPYDYQGPHISKRRATTGYTAQGILPIPKTEIVQSFDRFQSNCVFDDRKKECSKAFYAEVKSLNSIKMPAWALAISCVASIYGMYKIYDYFAESGSPMVGESEEVSARKHNKKHKQPSSRSVKFKRRLGMSGEGVDFDNVINDVNLNRLFAEGVPDPNAIQLIAYRLTNNLFTVKCDGRSCVGLAIGGRVAIMANHTATAVLDTRAEATFVFKDKTFIFKTTDMDIYQDTDMDIAFIEFPVTFPARLDIVSHFHSSKDLDRIGLDTGGLLTVADILMMEKDIVFMLKGATHIRAVGPMSYAYDGSDICIVNAFEYESPTQGGDCGAPLVAFCPGLQAKILGLHVAGANNLHGSSTVVTKEYLREVLQEQFSSNLFVESTNDVVYKAEGLKIVTFDDKIQYMGHVRKGLSNFIQEESKILESPLHKIFTTVTQQAALSMRKPLNPLRIGIEKGFVTMTDIPLKDLEGAVTLVQSKVNSMRSNYKDKGILSEYESLNGVQNDPWIRPMNMKTSPGFPYIKMKRKLSGKFDFVKELSEGIYEMTDTVRDLVIEREESAREGRIVWTLVCDILKDERLPTQKVMEARTRVFNVCPFDLNILLRKYFGAFIAHMEHNHMVGECSVGINPHSAEWGLLLQSLRRTGDNFIMGDYSSFDKIISYQIMMATLRIIQTFYDDEHELTRTVLFETLFSSNHLVGSQIYRINGGNPSGNALTVIVNSLANSILMRLSWGSLCKQYGYALSDFSRFVTLKVYGDDNILAVSDSVPWYTGPAIAQYFRRYGLNYKVEDDFVTLDKLKYLKRRFVFRNSFCWAPLEIQIIKESICWMHTKTDIEYNMQSTFRNLCYELGHYEEKEYNDVVNYILIEAAKLDLELVPLFYREILDDIQSISHVRDPKSIMKPLSYSF